jgi:hypothetical protein
LPSQKATVDGWTFEITASTSPFKLESRRDRLTIRGDATAYLTVRPAAPSPLRRFDQLLSDVCDLLTLASGVPCGLIEYTLRLVDDDVWTADGREVRHQRTVEVLGRRVHTADPDAPAQSVNRFRFTCSDLPFADALASWMPLAKQCRAAFDVYFGAYYAPPTFTDTRVLFAAIAAESLHGSLHPDATAMPSDEFDELTKKVRAALPASADRARLKQLFHNRPTLRQRLIELCDEPASEALVHVVPHTAEWAADVTRSRNGLAHTGGAADKVDLFGLARSSMAVIALVLMARLGIDEAVQVRAAEEMGR